MENFKVYSLNYKEMKIIFIYLFFFFNTFLLEGINTFTLLENNGKVCYLKTLL